MQFQKNTEENMCFQSETADIFKVTFWTIFSTFALLKTLQWYNPPLTLIYSRHMTPCYLLAVSLFLLTLSLGNVQKIGGSKHYFLYCIVYEQQNGHAIFSIFSQISNLCICKSCLKNAIKQIWKARSTAKICEVH